VTTLADVPIFGGLSPKTIDFLLERAANVAVSAGDHFFVEGELGNCLFVLELNNYQCFAICMCDVFDHRNRGV